jgi:hypothetical protein
MTHEVSGQMIPPRVLTPLPLNTLAPRRYNHSLLSLTTVDVQIKCEETHAYHVGRVIDIYEGRVLVSFDGNWKPAVSSIPAVINNSPALATGTNVVKRASISATRVLASRAYCTRTRACAH